MQFAILFLPRYHIVEAEIINCSEGLNYLNLYQYYLYSELLVMRVVNT